LTEALLQSGVTAIAYETVEVNRRLPLLEPMSEIAGRMSIIVGGYFLAKHSGGNGVLLGGVPGVLPGNVVVIGGGTSGVNAARMATGLGADVTILEVDVERMRFLDITMHTAHTLYSNEAHLLEMLPRTDLLVGAVLVPGARAPRLITREMLRLMRPGSVLVDIAIDQGGCCETSRPTTHHDPTYVEEGVMHYCVANMPGAYARTATQALTNVTSRYVEFLAEGGVQGAIKKQPALVGGINVMDGKIRNRAVAEAHGLPYEPL
jgi:alanine dehydrogenase